MPDPTQMQGMGQVPVSNIPDPVTNPEQFAKIQELVAALRGQKELQQGLGQQAGSLGMQQSIQQGIPPGGMLGAMPPSTYDGSTPPGFDPSQMY